ncbi:hypothetical protein AMTR_s00040p00231710 [Amborella trichopoda]|uniref:Uncharacterized protein n=1 Tax=Amborella trichopoda TaxID=13333 RepID=W1PYS0_AMBTC|nr:hypothetical protein AMTR_s00040p00231710 [Amborella trichopoda]
MEKGVEEVKEISMWAVTDGGQVSPKGLAGRTRDNEARSNPEAGRWEETGVTRGGVDVVGGEGGAGSRKQVGVGKGSATNMGGEVGQRSDQAREAEGKDEA